MFALKGMNIEKTDYVDGPLEDWTRGALRFNGINQYAVCKNDSMNQSFTYAVRNSRGNDVNPEMKTVTGSELKSPQVRDSNFLIEVYFRTEQGFTNGVLIEKMKNAGYSLAVNQNGGLTFAISDGKGKAQINSTVYINDGQWHHIIAEADRSAGTLTLYSNGRKDETGKGLAKGSSLENTSDLFVGGTPSGRYFNGALDFLRICLGTLSDAKTDIDELYAWEFDGPFLKDFTGRYPNGKRDAGALEK